MEFVIPEALRSTHWGGFLIMVLFRYGGLRGADRRQLRDGWFPLLEQELGQGSCLRHLSSPEPRPHHARLSQLPPVLVR